MATTTSVGVKSAASGSSSSSSSGDRLQSLGVQDFTKMLVAELKNQDPSQPMSNSDLLNQVSQIRAIESNDQLSSTLKSVLLGQNLASAGNLIGRTIKGLDTTGTRVNGPVSSVSISGNAATLSVGNSKVELSNVTDILPTVTSATTATTGN